jgi:hypothetical protein
MNFFNIDCSLFIVMAHMKEDKTQLQSIFEVVTPLYVTLSSSIVEECCIAHILKKRELRSLGIRENSVECLQKLLMPFPILKATLAEECQLMA